MKKVSLLFRKVVLRVLKIVYAGVRPLLGPRQVCRFSPSCSQYAFEAIEKHGICKGSWLACKRIVKCHPWSPGGVDPVP